MYLDVRMLSSIPTYLEYTITNISIFSDNNYSHVCDVHPRPVDKLYSCSLLAIAVATGKLMWYFQFTPHVVHDWDATEIPILLDANVGARMRKLIAMANRNAFYYLLDRATGEF